MLLLWLHLLSISHNQLFAPTVVNRLSRLRNRLAERGKVLLAIDVYKLCLQPSLLSKDKLVVGHQLISLLVLNYSCLFDHYLVFR